MTLQQLKYVVAIDRYSSFALAAEALDVTQPTLSGMVGKLERSLMSDCSSARAGR